MCYGATGGTGRRALSMYQERFSNRNHPHHIMFASLYQRLREEGCLRFRCIDGRPRQTRTPAFEEEVLQRVSNDPSTSTSAIARAIARAMGSNQSSVLRVLQEQNLHAYHLTPRVRFVQWFFATERRESCLSLFTDEACFTRDGYFNSRNCHIWDDENPHAVFIRVHQARFNVNIWGRILGDHLLGPVIIPEHASAAHGGDIPCDTQRNVVPT